MSVREQHRTRNGRHGGAALYALSAVLCAAHPLHAEAGPQAHTAVIEAMAFTPPVLQVNIGDTIVWKNEDPFPHTVTAENGSFDSGDIAAGASWKFTASKRGTFTYICTLHPTMKGSLVVK